MFAWKMKKKKEILSMGMSSHREWQELGICLQLPSILLFLPSPLPSSELFYSQGLESIISLVYTQNYLGIKYPVNICTAGEERTEEKNTRYVKKQFGGSKIKVFHRNQYGNGKGEACSIVF